MIALVLFQATTFIVLVTLFGMTGANAPTLVVNYDSGPLSQKFINILENDHHAFALTFISNETAGENLVAEGEYVCMIVIPANFTQNIQEGETANVTVYVDNINTDMTSDIQRSLPAAAQTFGEQLRFEGVNASVSETDIYPYDTSFVDYMIASALVLDSLIIAGTLGALAVADEFESKTAKLLAVAPVHPLIPLMGRVMTSALVSAGAVGLTVLFALLGYGITPMDPLGMALTLLLCLAVFSCLGAALGAAIKRTLPVAVLVLSLALPLYLYSGSYEPMRFDGNNIWLAAHFSPEYYAVGLMEHAVFGLEVTPEPLWLLVLVLAGFAIGSLALAGICSVRRLR
jgi:ABC-2 type transport system permease protein